VDTKDNCFARGSVYNALLLQENILWQFGIMQGMMGDKKIAKSSMKG
jgi:hypothetical protein